MTGAVNKLRAIEAEWMAKATRSAIDAAREVVTENDINGRAMIGSLNELEWGWICSAAVFAWIKTKSQQAVAEGVGYDHAIRAMPGRDPQPWDQGAVESILPALGDLKGVPWDKPIGDWSKNQMISFAWQTYRLVDQALAARDEGAECKITMNNSQARAERELSAKNGGPLLSRKELSDDEIPF
jgi:hypothetical protein